MENELKRIYDSEINVRISSFWDGGWSVAVGDEYNGYHTLPRNNVEVIEKVPGHEILPQDGLKIEEVIPALQELILKHYPTSTYTKRYLLK